ncbi:hypothetical protein ERD95_26375, partial [Enterobacteriaceae bacterium ML5]
MPPTPASRSKPWVATHTGLKRRLSPRLLRISGSFTARYRSLAMFQVARRQAGNLAAARFLLSVLEPWVSRPLRSARFLNRP